MKHSASWTVTFPNQAELRWIKKLVPGLNDLAQSLLTARARRHDVRERAVTVSRLASLGMTRDDISDLLARGWIDINGRFMDSSNVALTDAGLAFLQKAVPAGAIRPVYDVDSRKLIVAGETILTLAVQARNLAAFLGAIERAGWRPRIAKPLDGRRCRDSTHHLAVAIHRLNLQQRLIDFHTDDGAATWNWRPGQRSRNGAGARSNRD